MGERSPMRSASASPAPSGKAGSDSVPYRTKSPVYPSRPAFQPRASTSSMSRSGTSSRPRSPRRPSGTPSEAETGNVTPSIRISSPSSPASSSPYLPHPGTTEAPTADEQHEIDRAVVKRKRSLRGVLRSSSRASAASDEVFDAAAAHRETNREAEACAINQRHIDLIRNGHVLHTEAELGDPPKIEQRRYVWEVMYENQRGITLWGKQWYSCNSLLPGDPSPFTLPIELPETVMFEATVAGGMPPIGEAASVQRRETKPKLKHRSINTGYDLESYQTPSPAWVWITPWMVNMRLDTDEQGWRYNLWFHRSGWRIHPGNLNWYGWVRRRAWVRLRALVPQGGEKETDEDTADTKWPERLDDVLQNGDLPLDRIVRLLATIPLDRSKLDAWAAWLDKGSAAAMGRLIHLLANPLLLEDLARSFVFAESRQAFFDSLVKRGICSQQECNRCLGLERGVQW